MADKFFSKIQKLLALAGNNPSTEEAQSAMAMAQKLMIEHGFDQGDFEGQDSEQVNKTIKHMNMTELETNLAWWKRSLGVIIAENFRCFSYTDNWGKQGKKVVLCGLESDVEIAKQVYQFAVESIEYTSKLFRKEWLKQWTSWAEERKLANYAVNDFIKGYIKGMGEVFKEQVERNNWGLVLVQDALVTKEYAEMNFKKGRRSRVGSSGDAGAFEAGRQKGRQFNSAGAGRKRIGV